MKTLYTLGFLFNEEKTQVALIRKLRPEWQKGKLNGIGGKIEEGESALYGMQREFGEEANFPEYYLLDWKEFALIDNPNYAVHCFTAICSDLFAIDSKIDEKIEITRVDALHPWRIDILDNISWLVPMAIDFVNDGRPGYATITYP